MLIDDFFDEIVNAGIEKNDGVSSVRWKELCRNMTDTLLNYTTYVNISDIANQLLSEMIHGIDIPKIESLSCVIPPWGVGWFEFPIGKDIHKFYNVKHIYNHRVGVLVYGSKIDNFISCMDENMRKSQIYQFIFENIERASYVSLYHVYEMINNSVKRLVKSVLILDSYGKIINGKVYADLSIDDEKIDNAMSIASIYISIVVYAISVCNCKNVKLVESKDDNRKINIKRNKRGKRPLFRFNTISITEMTSRSSITDIGKHEVYEGPLKTVRGHIKDYREKGLFGKYKDMFWWSEYSVGSPKHGIIVKDYCVKSQE